MELGEHFNALTNQWFAIVVKSSLMPCYDTWMNLFIFWSLKPTNIMGGIKWYSHHTLYIFIYIYNQLVSWEMVLCDKTSYSRQTWQTIILVDIV